MDVSSLSTRAQIVTDQGRSKCDDSYAMCLLLLLILLNPLVSSHLRVLTAIAMVYYLSLSLFPFNLRRARCQFRSCSRVMCSSAIYIGAPNVCRIAIHRAARSDEAYMDFRLRRLLSRATYICVLHANAILFRRIYIYLPILHPRTLYCTSYI